MWSSSSFLHARACAEKSFYSVTEGWWSNTLIRIQKHDYLVTRGQHGSIVIANRMGSWIGEGCQGVSQHVNPKPQGGGNALESKLNVNDPERWWLWDILSTLSCFCRLGPRWTALEGALVHCLVTRWCFVLFDLLSNQVDSFRSFLRSSLVAVLLNKRLIPSFCMLSSFVEQIFSF